MIKQRQQRPWPSKVMIETSKSPSHDPPGADASEQGTGGEQSERQRDEGAGQRYVLLGHGQPEVDGGRDVVELLRVGRAGGSVPPVACAMAVSCSVSRAVWT